MLFHLGDVVVTPGVLAAFDGCDVGELVARLLARHRVGDWGEVCDEDKALNNCAVVTGDRILSAYTVAGTKLWVITEASRECTTVLLPSDY